MLISKRKLWVATGLALGLIASACGSFSPPESCGEGIGGTADESKFAQHFAQIELVNKATSQSGNLDAEGVLQFAAADQLAIRAESLAEVSVRACVQELKGGGQVAFDQVQMMAQGEDDFALGSFSPGSYVVRVIADGVLVKNLTFEIK